MEITERTRHWTPRGILDQEIKGHILAAGRDAGVPRAGRIGRTAEQTQDLEFVGRGQRGQTGSTDFAPGVDSTIGT